MIRLRSSGASTRLVPTRADAGVSIASSTEEHAMTGHAAIPEGVDPASAALLRRAYDLNDVAEGQQLYREWAESYDATMLDGLGYTAPRLLVELFAEAAPATFGPILDLACGTGLVGAELAQHGFTPIDGVDLSRAMMDVAARR